MDSAQSQPIDDFLEELYLGKSLCDAKKNLGNREENEMK